MKDYELMRDTSAVLWTEKALARLTSIINLSAAIREMAKDGRISADAHLELLKVQQANHVAEEDAIEEAQAAYDEAREELV